MDKPLIEVDQNLVTWNRGGRDYTVDLRMLTLDQWGEVINQNNEALGWNQPSIREIVEKTLADGILTNSIEEFIKQLEMARTPAEWAALAHTEISEAFEEHRNGNRAGETYFTETINRFGSSNKPEGQAIEYADALIRILHWFAYHKISANECVALKMAYNTTRGYRHGNKKA